MDVELRALTTITRALPLWKGMGRVASLAQRLYLRRPRAPVVMKVRGSRMRLHPDQFVDAWLLFAPKFYEDAEIRYVEATLRAGDTFLDIGAYQGLYALVAAQRVGARGRVLAIEADPLAAADLRQNVALNAARSVRVVETCVSDRIETRQLAPRATSNRSSASLLVNAPNAAIVQCRPLWDLVREQGFARIDGAKLDIEGFEHAVLERFFTDAPEAMWPHFLVTEFYESLVLAAGGNVLELLAARGYRQRARYETNYIFERASSSSR